MLLIDKLEGNSGIGVPVFSRSGQMQNYNFIVLSPGKKPIVKEQTDHVNEEHEKFKFKSQSSVTAPKETLSIHVSSKHTKSDFLEKSKLNGLLKELSATGPTERFNVKSETKM